MPSEHRDDHLDVVADEVLRRGLMPPPRRSRPRRSPRRRPPSSTSPPWTRTSLVSRSTSTAATPATLRDLAGHGDLAVVAGHAGHEICLGHRSLLDTTRGYPLQAARYPARVYREVRAALLFARPARRARPTSAFTEEGSAARQLVSGNSLCEQKTTTAPAEPTRLARRPTQPQFADRSESAVGGTFEPPDPLLRLAAVGGAHLAGDGAESSVHDPKDAAAPREIPHGVGSTTESTTRGRTL